jgi:undecaprenyl diphosphate synthase
MDGNGRWAKRKGLPRGEGHERGIQRAKEVINAVRTFGIKALTLYAFSSENWQRPPAEVDLLMEFLEIFLLTEMSEFKKQDIAFQAIGDLGKLPESVRRMVVCAEKLTAACKEMVLTIAISYGGRNEIVRATRKVLAAGIKPDKINEDVFSGFLDTAGLPEPDFIIRTSGEKRISNFLIWQLAYSQFYFTNTLWPDFGTEQLIEALRCYGAQEDMEKTIEN